MKIKTFNLTHADSDTKINEFLLEHEPQIEANGMYVFSDRVVFVYDDGTLEQKVARVLHRSIKTKLVDTCVKQFDAEQRAFEARRMAKSGTLKPDDVVTFENEKTTGEAKISYLQEKLDELENGDEFQVKE